MIRTSEFSECGKYRYQLARIWDDSKKVAMCIGLNPSTAGRKDANGEEEDDPTIRYLIGALTAQGYGGLRMVNLYAYITSNPDYLWSVPDPQGLNDAWLQETALLCQEFIYCWGSFPGISLRALKVREKFKGGLCFGKSQQGQPFHPMYLQRHGVPFDQAKLSAFVAPKVFF